MVEVVFEFLCFNEQMLEFDVFEVHHPFEHKAFEVDFIEYRFQIGVDFELTSQNFPKSGFGLLKNLDLADGLLVNGGFSQLDQRPGDFPHVVDARNELREVQAQQVFFCFGHLLPAQIGVLFVLDGRLHVADPERPEVQKNDVVSAGPPQEIILGPLVHQKNVQKVELVLQLESAEKDLRDEARQRLLQKVDDFELIFVEPRPRQVHFGHLEVRLLVEFGVVLEPLELVALVRVFAFSHENVEALESSHPEQCHGFLGQRLVNDRLDDVPLGRVAFFLSVLVQVLQFVVDFAPFSVDLLLKAIVIAEIVVLEVETDCVFPSRLQADRLRNQVHQRADLHQRELGSLEQFAVVARIEFAARRVFRQHSVGHRVEEVFELQSDDLVAEIAGFAVDLNVPFDL